MSGMLVSATPESRFLDARIFSKQRIDIQYDIGYYLYHQERKLHCNICLIEKISLICQDLHQKRNEPFRRFRGYTRSYSST